MKNPQGKAPGYAKKGAYPVVSDRISHVSATQQAKSASVHSCSEAFLRLRALSAVCGGGAMPRRRVVARNHFTVTFTFAVLPLELFTVMVTVPFLTPFTLPLLSTVAIFLLLLFQV